LLRKFSKPFFGYHFLKNFQASISSISKFIMGPKVNSRRSQRRPPTEDILPTSSIPAAASTVAEDSIQSSNSRQAEDPAEDSSSSDHSDFWQTAQSRCTAKTARRAAEESRSVSLLTLQDPTQDVPMTFTSSASFSAPVESLLSTSVESSSSSASSSAPVESLLSTSVESSTSSEVSFDDHLNEIQRQYVANAMLMARSLSLDQLQKRTRHLSDQLSAIETTDQATDHSTSSISSTSLSDSSASAFTDAAESSSRAPAISLDCFVIPLIIAKNAGKNSFLISVIDFN
jgi:hypothetical protein